MSFSPPFGKRGSFGAFGALAFLVFFFEAVADLPAFFAALVFNLGFFVFLGLSFVVMNHLSNFFIGRVTCNDISDKNISRVLGFPHL